MSAGDVVAATVFFVLAAAVLILAALVWRRKGLPFGNRPLNYGYRQAIAVLVIMAAAGGVQGAGALTGDRVLRVAGSGLLLIALVVNIVHILRERRR